jgi:ankyrin repeat protein
MHLYLKQRLLSFSYLPPNDCTPLFHLRYCLHWVIESDLFTLFVEIEEHANAGDEGNAEKIYLRLLCAFKEFPTVLCHESTRSALLRTALFFQKVKFDTEAEFILQNLAELHLSRHPRPTLQENPCHLLASSLHRSSMEMLQSFRQLWLRHQDQLPEDFFLTLPPLHRVIQHENHSLASSLTSQLPEIQPGFPIDQRDIFLQTACFHAAEQGKEESFRILLRFNPRLDYRDIAGRTMLEVAARSGSLPIVKCLIEEQNVNYSEDLLMCGSTPLQAAIESGNLELVQYVLSLDPPVYIHRIFDGKSAVDLAAEKGFAQVVTQLNEMGRRQVALAFPDNDNFTT